MKIIKVDQYNIMVDKTVFTLTQINCYSCTTFTSNRSDVISFTSDCAH